jgi:hypothetical protein
MEHSQEDIHDISEKSYNRDAIKTVIGAVLLELVQSFTQ